ncbi:DUF5706 domain-containing protein [Clostridium sp. CS001]|uniref:Pycsar system effector family protein n=1 Tax=Clostridium sp. CS001 TaxID=2880648 RepID=UPI001CF11BF6|nr:Pycsar system effector family protein [Clostridium sp. CS001]MCB2290822.1 DUF5706 domain-containing protein [Clostridium sp. CS001]
MKEDLKATLANINDWLKFAEAKNAILITLNGGMIFAFLSSFNDKMSFASHNVFSYNFFLRIYYWEFVIFAILGLVIALISFYPQIKRDIFWFTVRAKTTTDNLQFFGDIEKYTANEYLELIKSDSNYSFEKLEKDYANQIVINSRITYRKNKYAQVAVFLTLSAIGTIFMGIIFSLILNPNE